MRPPTRPCQGRAGRGTRPRAPQRLRLCAPGNPSGPEGAVYADSFSSIRSSCCFSAAADGELAQGRAPLATDARPRSSQPRICYPLSQKQLRPTPQLALCRFLCYSLQDNTPFSCNLGGDVNCDGQPLAVPPKRAVGFRKAAGLEEAGHAKRASCRQVASCREESELQ